jgi:hypothetical protein
MGINNLLGPKEFFERFQGRYFGKYEAIVKETADPRRLGRIRVYCETLYGRDLSPWCRPCYPMGNGVESGFFTVPPVDSLVWIECVEGITNYPLWIGGPIEEVSVGRPQDGSPLENAQEYQTNPNMLPSHAQGLPDGSDFDGTSRETPGVPGSSYVGQYGKVSGLKTAGGNVLEFDDTPGGERVLIMHKTGAFIEITPDGSIHQISEGAFRSRARGEVRTIEGGSRETVRGTKRFDIDGDLIFNVGGAYRISASGETSTTLPRQEATITGDDIAEVQGSWERTVVNSFELQAGGDGSLGTFGNLNIQAGGVGSIIYSNALNIPNPLAETLNVIAQGGRLTLKSTDQTGLLAQYGIEIQPQGTTPPLTPTPVPASIGPHIYIGNLLRPPQRGPSGVPLTQENAVMGQTLFQYLQGLQTFLELWLSDYLLHAHPWFSPAYTAPIQAGILTPALATLRAAFLTPLPPKLNPLILSDVVYMGKA